MCALYIVQPCLIRIGAHTEILPERTDALLIVDTCLLCRGPAQARLMDALVFHKDSPEAEAATAAVAAAEAAAAAAAGDGSTPADAPLAAATDADAEQQGEGADAEQQQEEEQEQQGPRKDPAHKATHVLIVRDPAGRILTVPYEYGKNHKTHGANRKLWVIKLMDQLGLHQGDLLVATKEPFEFKPLAVRQQEQLLQQQQQKLPAQPDGPWKKVLDRYGPDMWAPVAAMAGSECDVRRRALC